MSNQKNNDESSDREPSVDEIIDDIASEDGEDEAAGAGGGSDKRERKNTAGAEGLFGVESRDEAGSSESTTSKENPEGPEKPEKPESPASQQQGEEEHLGPNEPTAPSPHLQTNTVNEEDVSRDPERKAGSEQQKQPSESPDESSGGDSGQSDEAIDSVLSPGGDSGGGGGDDIVADDPMLDNDDDDLMSDFASEGMSQQTKVMGAVIVALLGGLIFFVFQFTEVGADLIALFKGELKQKRIAEAQAKEEAFKEKQLEKMTKYGTLRISGKPKYALIKLNGDVQYGKPSGSDVWTKLRLSSSTAFQNLQIGEKHQVAVSNPGFETENYEVTEGMWEGGGDNSLFGFRKKLSVQLPPKSADHKMEFQQRLEKDPANNYFGEITIRSEPKGAFIYFNNHPLKNEDGELMKTPATFEKYYVPEDEDSDRLEEKKVRVDTPPDRGHKVVLRLTKRPEDTKKGDKKGESKSEQAKNKQDQGDQKAKGSKEVDIKDLVYATNIERQMWTCNWKDDDEIERLPDDAPYPKRCNYSFTLDFDFKGLKGYIKDREKRKKEMEKERKELKKVIEKQKKKILGG